MPCCKLGFGATLSGPGSSRKCKDIRSCFVRSRPFRRFAMANASGQIDGKTVEYLDAWSYTAWFNLLGNPAAVVPISQSNDGLPIGVQIVGRPWQDEEALAVARLCESECGAWTQPPIDEWVRVARLVCFDYSADYPRTD